MNTEHKKKHGYGFVEYKSKPLNFTIFDDGSGYCEVRNKDGQIYVDESGTHEQRTRSLNSKARHYRTIADQLAKAAQTMAKHKYDIPK